MTEPAATIPEVVQVLLPLPVPAAYDYAVPAHIHVETGSFVRVPLGPRVVTGVVRNSGGGNVPESRLREICGVFDIPPLKPSMLQFINRTAGYTVSNEGSVLRMIMRVEEALEPLTPVRAFQLIHPRVARMTPARLRVSEFLSDGVPRTLSEVSQGARVSGSVIKGLVRLGCVEEVELQPPSPVRIPDHRLQGLELSEPQKKIADDLKSAVDASVFTTTVLEGVTGSGKTEVYFEAVARALEKGLQVLILLPEIALGTQFLSRFETRFGTQPAIWNSDIPRALKRRIWRGVATGEIRAVVGARSALFLPFEELGLLVVDEEHDGSYKQEEGVCYHARDMAVLRASIEDIPIVLCSATPSLETLANIDRGRYRHFNLPKRHGGATMPEVVPVNMRINGPDRGNWIAPLLVSQLKTCLEAGEQALIFLNRRGYAPLTLCRNCGFRFSCPECSAWLVEHRQRNMLQCHHCDHRLVRPSRCPECEEEDSLVACGPGVERTAEEVTELFPDARIVVMASDTLSGSHEVAELVARIERHEIDILIGTQIAAKGHHYPLLTLVGVIDADLGLEGGDPRVMERTWQLLNQVSGRAGRESRPGKVILQTYQPQHPVMHALISGNSRAFLKEEKRQRQIAGMPPYGRLAAIVISGRKEGEVRALAYQLARSAPNVRELEIHGPAPAPLVMLRGRYRWRLLIKASRRAPLQDALRQWVEPVRLTGDLHLRIDVDPMSFL